MLASLEGGEGWWVISQCDIEALAWPPSIPHSTLAHSHPTTHPTHHAPLIPHTTHPAPDTAHRAFHTPYTTHPGPHPPHHTPQHLADAQCCSSSLRCAGGYVTCCFCLAAGEVAHRTGGTYFVDCGVPLILGCLMSAATGGVCNCPLHCFFMGPTRDRLRRMYRIEDVRGHSCWRRR